MLRREFLFGNSEDAVKARNYRDRINFLGLQNFNFKEYFCLNPIQADFLLNNVGQKLEHNTQRSHALSAENQLLLCLHWLGNGCQYHGVAALHSVAKSTVCRTIHRVVDIITDTLFQKTVRWPDDVSGIAEKFFLMGGFPSVCGCVDGTIIKIDAPPLQEERYADRHRNHSLNVMMICGPDYTFYSVNASWPGSVHDSRVLRNSAVSQRFDNGWRPFPDAVVLGDSGYGLKNWLIPPLRRNPNNPAEEVFNRCHKKTRRIIENSFGIIKERFPCLNYLRLRPEFAGKTVIVCAILHNIACSIGRSSENIQPTEDTDNEREELDESAEEEDDALNNIDQESGMERVTSLLQYFT
ncbi:putative nuclease HARBI1 [Bactrocera neohumeralis]|uniref:putative nuclease HARBI1 n=1 Tax=Bactrocera neohumeralis TaxID=98809 RepID=UPI0021668F0D|nr:putative nuclease HARBI1 [Bactrocera neohumeralis]